MTDGTQELLIATKDGKCIRFDEQQVRPMGRNTAGVKAVELEDGDTVVGMTTTDPERKQVLAVCQRGFGKKTPLEEFRVQNRGGKGIILIDCSERNGPVVGVALVKTGDEVVLITDRGQTIRTSVNDIRETGRNAQGVKLMNVEDDERIVAVEIVGERVEEENPEEPDAPDTLPTPTAVAHRRSLRMTDPGRTRRAGLLTALERAYPDAHCELIHKNPFQLLVATVLSAQSTDAAVNQVTPGLFRRWPSPKALATADTEQVEAVLARLGMYRQKSRHIIGLSQAIAERHNGRVPESLDELVKLPGVGRKTANVVLGVAFGKPEGVVVDTHVQRLSQRLGFSLNDQPERIEQDLMELFPRDKWDSISHTLIFHGRRCCTARKPNCAGCPVQRNCPSAFGAEHVGRKPPRIACGCQGPERRAALELERWASFLIPRRRCR